MRGLGRERKRSWKSKKEGDKDRNIYSTWWHSGQDFKLEPATHFSTYPGSRQNFKDGFISLTLFIGNMVIFITSCTILS